MTAIAYRDGIMAADTVGWTCDSHVKIPVRSKIKRLDDGGLVACAGEAGAIEAFLEAFCGGRLSTLSPFEKGDITVVWVKPDRSIWLCGHKLRFCRVEHEFFAIGAPAEFLWGALFAGASAETAVRLAVHHTDGAGGDVQVERH